MKSYEKLQKVMKLYENVMRNTCERLSAQIAINMFFSVRGAENCNLVHDQILLTTACYH